MYFSYYDRYAIRNIGEMIVLVNIYDNSIYEIDNKVQEYLENAQKNSGHFNLDDLTKSLNIEKEILLEDIKELINTLENHCNGRAD